MGWCQGSAQSCSPAPGCLASHRLGCWACCASTPAAGAAAGAAELVSSIAAATRDSPPFSKRPIAPPAPACAGVDLAAARSFLRSAARPLPRILAMTDVAAVEETVKRLASHKGVVGIVILNGDGVPIRTTLDQELATTYAALAVQLGIKARHMVRELAEDGTDELQFLRVRSKKHEIMIAPGFERVRWVGG